MCDLYETPSSFFPDFTKTSKNGEEKTQNNNSLSIIP